ncbi:MAG: hypothetical protein HQ488_01790 [Parcubacteria group bacterium]|nr:hypothetical protein [Parcubacteria group bacterium]
MDPLLTAVDGLFVLIGLFVLWIGWRLQRRGDSPHKAALPVFIIGGVILCIGGTMTPSRILKGLTSEHPSEGIPEQQDQEDRETEPDGLTVVEGGPKGQTIIITQDKDLIALLTRAIGQLPELSVVSTELPSLSVEADDDDSGDDVSATDDDDSGDGDSAASEIERDPFQVTVLEESSEPVVVTPVMTHPRARIRTLPEESKGDTHPLCTGFKLIHGQAGGPEPGGCHVVGCAQGYALPMQHLPSGGWGPCADPKRVERIDQCYVVPDADGTESGRTFSEDGSWTECPVS